MEAKDREESNQRTAGVGEIGEHEKGARMRGYVLECRRELGA